MNHTQILIAGQGLAGSLLAEELRARKIDFRVMDLPDPGAASQVAGGAYIPLVFRTLKKASMVDEYLRAMHIQYARLDKLLAHQLIYPKPSLKLFQPALLPQWQQAAQTDSGAFMTEIVESVNLQGVARGKAGVVIEPSGYVDTKLLTRLIAQWLKKEGLYIEERLDYNTPTFGPEGVVVNGNWKAEKVVFAEGVAALNNPWFQWAGFALNKGEILEIHAAGLSEEFILRQDVFVLPLGNHFFRVGATYNRNYTHADVTEAGCAELLQKLNDIVTVPFIVTSMQAGIRPAVKDRNPLLGAHPEIGSLFIFNGLGSKGVLTGPYWATKMADLLLGDSHAIPSAFSVKRYWGKRFLI